MTAKEMFEEMKLYQDNTDGIEYWEDSYAPETFGFLGADVKFGFYEKDFDGEKIRTFYTRDNQITDYQLDAIIQQAKELGWID